MRYLVLIFILSFVGSHAQAQTDPLIEYDYPVSDEIFINPERGFFTYNEAVPGNPVMSASALRANREQGRSMIWRLYTIPSFRNSDFTDAFLNQLRGDFAAMREAGVKCILRFRYSTAIGEADAPLDQVLRHIEQLVPIFEENYDVITVLNAGFIGAWGEWHASTNNLTTVANMRTILYALIDALPERSVQIRYPQAKQQIFGNTVPVSAEEAFNGSYKSRSGHNNDCFVASATDVGTYRGSIVAEKNYLHLDTRYTSMGGETCNPRPEWTNYGCARAMTELAQMRWSTLNTNYSRITLDRWVDEGCMPDVERRLGYRLAALNGAFNETVAPGSPFTFNLDLTNLGFAAPMNRRGLQVLLRDLFDPEVMFEVNLPEDPRFWLGGDTIQLRHQIRLPDDIPDSIYELLLNLPDPMPLLRNNPDFSIRLANPDMWDAEFGFNRLSHLLVVDSDHPAESFTGTLDFVPFGTSTSIGDKSTGAQSPSGIELHPNYPNPFNPTTEIGYRLASPMTVKLTVFDLLGREIKVLVDQNKPAGDHRATFDASGLSSGIYLYQLQTSTDMITKSMILLK